MNIFSLPHSESYFDIQNPETACLTSSVGNNVIDISAQ